MGREVPLLDGSYGLLYQVGIISACFFRDSRVQILDLGVTLADEDDQCGIGYSRHPGITNELWVERKKPSRLFAVTLGRGLPIDEAMLAIDRAECVHIGNEVV